MQSRPGCIREDPWLPSVHSEPVEQLPLVEVSKPPLSTVSALSVALESGAEPVLPPLQATVNVKHNENKAMKERAERMYTSSPS